MVVFWSFGLEKKLDFSGTHGWWKNVPLITYFCFFIMRFSLFISSYTSWEWIFAFVMPHRTLNTWFQICRFVEKLHWYVQDGNMLRIHTLYFFMLLFYFCFLWMWRIYFMACLWLPCWLWDETCMWPWNMGTWIT